MQLEMLVAAVEEGSLHKAAERVFRTQPAVTMALRKLEDELGAPLFDRTNRGEPALTETGKVFYEYAKRLLNLRNEALAAVADVHGLRRGCVRIGANEITNLYVLPRLIVAFREQYAEIKIDVVRQLSTRLPQELRDRNLDLAILSIVPEEGDFEAKPILRDGLVLIVSPDHWLARRDHVSVRELGAEPFITPKGSSGSRKTLVEVFKRFQTPLNVSIENSSFEAIKKLVAVNAGVAFVPRMCLQEELSRGELVIVPVEGFPHERTLWVVRRRSDAHSHAAQAFFRVIDTLAGQLAREHSAAATGAGDGAASRTVN
jgi:DNA-binding transcriptional LysR family regulator